MYRTLWSTALAATSVISLAGCQSQQAKIDTTQKEYDRLAAQFQTECSAEYYKVPPTLSPKCSDEKKQMDDAWSRLQAEKAKK